VLKGFPGEVGVMNNMEGRRKCRRIGVACRVMGKLVGAKRDGRRCSERRGGGGKEEVVGKTAKPSEVVYGERNEDNSLIVEAGDDLGSVRGLGATTVEF
jgi:hypothetical protein